MARKEQVVAKKKTTAPGIAQLANQYVSNLQKVGAQSPQADFTSSLWAASQAPKTDFGDFEPIAQPDSGGIGETILDYLTRPLAAVAGASRATSRNINVIQGEKPSSEAINPFDAFWKGLTGDEKYTFADTIYEDMHDSDLNKVKPFAIFGDNVGKTPQQIVQSMANGEGSGPSVTDAIAGVGGLGLDISLDPINAVVGPAVKGVTVGAKFLKGLGKTAPEVQRSVTGVSAVPEHLRELPEEAAETTAAAAPSIADNIVSSAEAPLSPSVIPVNAPRKASEPTVTDNFSMGATLSDLTSKASKKFDSVERAKPRIPSYINEINPDDYAEAVNFVRGGDFIKPQHLVDWFDHVDIKTAQRFLSMMEKDGIVETSLQAAKRMGKKPHAYISRNVVNKGRGVDDVELMTSRVMATPEIRAASIYDSVMPEMRAHFDDLADKGIPPKVTSVDNQNYTLSTSDILESLPRQSVEQLNFGATGKANLYPSQWHAGAAQALRMSELGTARDVAVDEVTRAMRGALRGNAARRVAIESTGNLNRAAETLVDSTTELAARVALNAKRFGTKDAIDMRAIVQTHLDDINGKLASGTTGDAINAVTNVGQDIAKSARNIGATPDASIAAAHQIAPEVAKRVPEADARFARNAQLTVSDRSRLGYSADVDGKILKRLNSSYVLVARDVARMEEAAGIKTLTLGEKHGLTMNSFHERLMHPLREALEFGYKSMGKAHDWRTGSIAAESDQHIFRQIMRELSKKHGSNINAAWTAYRRSSVPSDPAIFAAYTDLQGVWNHTLGNGLQGRIFRNGASLDAINAALDEVGVSYRFKAPTKKEDFAKVPDQSQDWDIKDPLSDLEKINKAALLVETRQTVATSFAAEFGSSVPKPGYVKLNFGKNSKLGPHLDKGLYFPREAGEAIYQLDKLVSLSRSFAGQKGLVAGLANNLIDPVMRIWKPFMTIARPGFIPRNLLSDVIMGSFNDVVDPGSYATAAKALGAAGEFTSKTAGIKGLESLRDGNYVSGAGTALTYRGKPISYQGLYKLAHENGLIQSWHVTEDIIERPGTISEKLMNNPYMRTMGKANEVEGQFVRIAHFTDLLKRNKSIEQAAKEVRRFHPDVSGLTPIETKYGRRIFPFYTWLRQAIPVVFSTMLSKPGRVTGIFKAEYNAAIATGVNPDSVIDPFPDDRLYPSFVRDNLVGPMFGDVGLNLGSPQEGVLQDVLQANPLRNIGGMVNPILKAPYEIATRTQIGTGGNIADMSDYIDSQLPIVNQVANISGHSVTGLGAEQRAVEMGEKNKLFNYQMLNFLTGLGLQDYGKPSYKRFAAKEADL